MRWFIQTFKIFLLIELGVIVLIVYLFRSPDRNVTIFLNNVSILFIFLTFLSLLFSFIVSYNNDRLYKYLEQVLDDIQHSREPNFAKFNNKNLSKIFFSIKEIYKTLNRKQKIIEEEKESIMSIISAMDEGLIILDSKGFIELINQKAKEFLSIKEDVDDKNILDLCKNHLLLNSMKNLLNNDKKSIFLELSSKYLMIKSQNINEKKLLLINDITQQKQYEAMKARFFSDASHELKTPIASIMGYAETLLDNPNLDKQTADRFLGYIESNAKNLNELIEDILKLHRLEISKTIKQGSCNLKSVCNELSIAFSRRIEDKEQLEFIVQCEEIDINVAEEYIKSILWNLTDNAIKYTHSGSVNVKCYKDNGFIYLQVSDTGVGIKPEDTKRIFERFFTTQKARNKSISGTGLGLSIVKHVVQLLNAEIELESKLGKGSVFTVKIKL